MPPCTTRTIAGDVWTDAASLVQAEVHAEVLDDARAIATAEQARLRLVDALAATRTRVQCWLVTGEQVTGHVDAIGADFVIVASDAHRVTAVRIAAIARLSGLASTALRDEPDADVPQQHAETLTAWLRGQLSPWPTSVVITTADGWAGAGQLIGVHADHVRLHCADAPVLDVRLGAVCSITLEMQSPPTPR
ncbi:MAG: hypothetical protein PHU75_12225 [Candidatus Nanopelagicales bacterium]|nr:hypothetical protein [Candidatus Nanopelagicales bacterium]